MQTVSLTKATEASLSNGDTLILPCEVNYYLITTDEQVEEAVQELLTIVQGPEAIIALDIETSGFDPFIDDILLLQIGTAHNIQYVFDSRSVKLSPLLPVLSAPCWKLGHNLKFDAKFITTKLGVKLTRLFDTFLAEKVIRGGEFFGGERYALDSVLKRRIGVEMTIQSTGFSAGDQDSKSARVKKQMQTSFGRLPRDVPYSPAQLAYAAQDVSAETIFKLAEWQMSQLKKALPSTLHDSSVCMLDNSEVRTKYLEVFPAKKSLWDTAKLEFKFLELVIDMELGGIGFCLDTHREVLTNIEADYKAYRKEFLSLLGSKAKQKTFFGGAGINPDSPSQVLVALNDLGLRLEDTNSDTLDNKTRELDPTSHEYKTLKSLLNYRGLSKLFQAFGEKLSKHVHPVTKRIHFSINQILDTGRISNSDPNLQQIVKTIDWKLTGDPVQDAVIKSRLGLRECFQARPGYRFLIFDYSQQELRVAASISLDKGMIRAFKEGKELHSYSASLMYNESYETFVKKYESKDPETVKRRGYAKVISFGALYGSGAPNLAQKLHIPLEQAQEILDRYWSTYAALRDSMKRYGELANQFGYSNTVLGRRRYYTDILQKIKWVEFENNPSVIQRRMEELKMFWFFREYGDVTLSNLEKAKKAIIRKFRGEINRQAGNHHIQGTSADITKLAAVNLRKQFRSRFLDASIVALVHDEIIVEAELSCVSQCEELMKDEMNKALNVFCPNVVSQVDGSISEFWRKD